MENKMTIASKAFLLSMITLQELTEMCTTALGTECVNYVLNAKRNCKCS